MKKLLIFAAYAALGMGIASCSKDVESGSDSKQNVFTLTHGKMTMTLSTNGARIMSLSLPDRDGVMRDVVLGFDESKYYGTGNNNVEYGATVGRYANRIANAELTIDGMSYRLTQNDGNHCIHGGYGWHTKTFELVRQGEDYATFCIVSPDGDNGFPGEVTAYVTYHLQDNGTLRIDYSATTTKATVVNMTNHAYFNLSGNPNADVRNHQLMINANGYTPVDSTLIPTAYSDPVDGTEFDFRSMRVIKNEYDQNFVLATNGNLEIEAAQLYCAETGIHMSVYTTEPGMQCYTGNGINPGVVGKNGIRYGNHSAVCLETEHCPDSPHHSDWPSTMLRPGETYTSTTFYRFWTE